MTITAVLEPAALDRSLFSNAAYGQGARVLFETLHERGILLVDSENRMLGEIIRAIPKLPTKYGQRIEILFTNLAKGKRKRLVECPAGKGQTSVLRAAIAIAEANCPDGFICHPGSLETIKEVGVAPDPITPDEFIGSAAYDVACRLRDLPSPIDKLTTAQVAEVLSRPLRYARRLRFFDKQIGKGSNPDGFQIGIEYILDLWHKASDFAEGGDVEVYTLAKHDVSDELPLQFAKSQLKENEAAISKVESQILDPLRAKFKNPITLHIKRADPKKVHPRYLQAGAVLINIDRGFDFVNRDGTFKEGNPVLLDLNAFDHVTDFQNLPESRRLT